MPGEQAERFSETQPGHPSIIRFPGTGHLVPLGAPQELAADVDSRLSSPTAAERMLNFRQTLSNTA